MSSMSAAAPDPAQELGAEDEVTAFNNEEEGEYEGDESLNDIKDELQLEADSDKAKVCAYVRFRPVCVSCSYVQLLVLVVFFSLSDLLWPPTSYYRSVASCTS